MGVHESMTEDRGQEERACGLETGPLLFPGYVLVIPCKEALS